MVRQVPSVAPGGRLAIVLAAAAAAVTLTVSSEGWILRTAPDPVGIPTACAGVTKGVIPGHTYTEAECLDMTAKALVEHGLAIDRCIKVQIPTETRAAFTDFAYNVGPQAFCTSTLARKLNAGDVRGACAELSHWTTAKGRVLPGLVERRRKERAKCESGLA